MAETAQDSTYRISGLYVTPNWNGNSDRVAMSCGIGANIKVLRKVSIGGQEVVIAADTAGAMARSWNMTAKNTILRTTANVYLYARVERNGVNGMYIWSANFYDIDGTVPAVDGGEQVKAVNNDQYYYIRVGYLNEDRITYEIDEGQYGLEWGEDGREDVGYDWSDLIAWDRARDFLVFLKTIAGLAIDYIILKGRELNKVLTSDDDENESSNNAVVTAGFLQKWVNKIKGMFLRKDADDETTHQLTMGKAVSNDHHTTRFTATSGEMGGVGAGMWMLEDGTGIMETDLFYVRRAAYFRSLTIAEVKHMGGEVVLSAAACQIAYVVPYDMYGNPIQATVPEASASVAFYRCYFEKQAGGRKVYNEWMPDDQARCQRFDANGNAVESSFYWRLVIGVGEDEDFYYVDLSNEDCAEDSNPPQSNDNIVLLGHRNIANHDRTCAQVYSTVGVHAPSRVYYAGITSYDLSKAQRPEYLERDQQGNIEWYVGGEQNGVEHYIKYNTRTGLDIRTSSMTVIADGGDKVIDVAEVLGDSWSFFTTENEARKEGKDYVEWMAAAELVPNEAERWDSSVWKNYLNYQIITPHGITYKLDMNGDEVMWHLNTDRYLLHAQETADAAIQNLEDIANDNIVTVQEKSRLNDIYTQINEEGTNVFNDATQVGMRDIDTRVYRIWRSALMAMISYITSREGDVELVKENGEQLVVTMQRYDSIPSVSYGIPDEVVAPMTPDPTAHKVTYKDCYKWYYYRLSQVRQSITVAMRRSIDNIIVSGSDVNEYVNQEIGNLRESLNETNGVIEKVDGDVGALATIVHYPDKSVEFSGFVTKSNFASVFSTEVDKEGNEVSAIITAYVQAGVSGISLSADKIDFEASDITIFSQNFRISSKELSIYYDEARNKEIIVINTDNFKLDEDGNAYFQGEVNATSGTFSGRVRALEGFDMSYSILDVASHAANAQIDAESSVAIVKFSQSNNTVILPRNPRPGQVLKILPLGQSTQAKDLRVTIPGQSYILVTRTDCRKDNGIPLVGSGKVGEFIFIPNIDGNGNGGWYYMSEV